MASCNRDVQKADKAYFDFDSLISIQVMKMVNAGMEINKRAIINGKEAESSFRADSVNLANELEVFRQLDIINKPRYRNAYQIIDGQKDTKSNLLIRTYLTDSLAPVPFVKFYYQTAPRMIRRIESVYHEENALYNAKRNLIMQFEDIEGTMQLTGYEITGVQKMILSDTVKFSLDVSFSSDQH